MPNNIALRSPQFKYIEIPVANFPLSVQCKISIDGVNRYTLVRNNPTKGSTANFDISELARDYLEITYKSTFVPDTVDIITDLTMWDTINGAAGGGSDAAYTAVQFVDVGFEAYGTYEDGANPTLPTDAFLISESTNPVEVNILYPTPISGVGFGGFVPKTVGGVVSVVTFGQSATTITGYASTIQRIDCTKYGYGNEITFINKFGVQQVLWFFLKKAKKISRKNEGYKANTITYPSTNNPATYSIQDAPNKVFNTQAKQSHKLSSGYYPEDQNQFFEQLLLSEYIWLKLESSSIRIPVKVKTSTMDFKTSVNDRLIEYTIDFEEAFDYINNIR